MTATNTVNLAPIEAALRDLPIAIDNQIDRNARASLEKLHKGLPMLLRYSVRVATTTLAAIRALTFDRQHRGAPGAEGGEYPSAALAVAVPPLARTFLDSLFAIVFVFEKPADRMRWYMRSGWREATMHQARLEARHGQDPAWTKPLAERRAWIDSHDHDLVITVMERQTPKLASPRWFPNPGKMRDQMQPGAMKDYLGYLSEWFYSRLSQDAHLSYVGLAIRGGILADAHLGATQERYRHEVFLTSLVLYLALLSEVAIHCGLTNERGRLRDVWQHLNAFPIASDLSRERYEKAL